MASWLLSAPGAWAAVIVAGNVPVGDLPVFGAMLLVCAACAAVAAAIGVLVGSAVRDRLQASLVAIAAWFLLAIGLDLVVIGLGVFLELGEPAILAAVLANPIEAARVSVLLLLDAGGGALGPMGTYLSENVGSEGSLGLLLGALAAWVLLPLGIATWVLDRRDL